MTYIFVFLGEFGYELLNWQGVIQKFLRLRPGTRVFCASRGQVAPLYPGTTYVDIGDVECFRGSVATGYSAFVEDDFVPTSAENVAFDRRLRRDLRAAILQRLRDQHGWRVSAMRLRGVRFVFSSSKTSIADCEFGADPRLFGNVPGEGDIYEALDLRNNFYARIEGDPRAHARVQERCPVDLSHPFVVVQSRRRDTSQRSTSKFDEQALVEGLAAHLPVVLLNFATGRLNDSYSRFADIDGTTVVTVDGFDEQAALITAAARCVFTTEGDFGSHMYVPPMLGRDVVAVAPRDVFALGTTPIDFWNRAVFRFGGQIEPLAAEDLDPATLGGQIVAAPQVS